MHSGWAMNDANTTVDNRGEQRTNRLNQLLASRETSQQRAAQLRTLIKRATTRRIISASANQRAA